MFYESIEAKKYTKKLHNLLLKVIYYDLDDPLFKRITVNSVKLNRTKTMATVYLDLMSIKDKRKRKLALKKINQLNWLFKNSLKPHINKYRIPFFKFVEDKLLEKGMRVEDLIRKSLENGQGD